MANVIAGILKPILGKSQHHIKSTEHFVEQIKGVALGPGECIVSYDFTSLFISVTVVPALDFVQKNQNRIRIYT